MLPRLLRHSANNRGPADMCCVPIPCSHVLEIIFASDEVSVEPFIASALCECRKCKEMFNASICYTSDNKKSPREVINQWIQEPERDLENVRGYYWGLKNSVISHGAA